MSIAINTLSYLQDTEKTMPMLLLEVPATLGRTYQGYKRGGKPEAGERICEETLGAAVWLFGAKAFNKIGDFIGKNIFGLKDLDVNVGKDSLRDPFYYVQNKRLATAAFKFTKITTSAVASMVALGYAVPQIKKAMTNAKREKAGLEPIPNKNGTYNKGWADKIVGLFIKNNKNNGDLKSQKNPCTFDVDINKFLQNVSNNNNPAFTGVNILNGILFASHNLENNTAWRLLSTDAGTLTGRVATSRTKKEGIEYLARDSISDFAYIFAAPLFSMMLRKTTKTPNVPPKALDVLNKHINKIIEQNGYKIQNNFLSSKIKLPDAGKKIIDNLKFSKDEVISLEDFNIQTQFKYQAKAEKMSKLQPLLHNKAVLSKMQAEDILSNSYTSSPEFLNEAISCATKGKSNDKFSYISRNKLEKIRKSFDEFIYGLEKYAAKKGKDIDIELVNKYTKNLSRKNLAVHFAGIAFAASCLGIFIPKLQYIISDIIEPDGGFAGVKESDK